MSSLITRSNPDRAWARTGAGTGVGTVFAASHRDPHSSRSEHSGLDTSGSPGHGSTPGSRPDLGADRPNSLDSPEASFVPRLAVWIATAAGLGYAPSAPGTFGSAAGVGLFFLFAHLGLPLYLLTAAALSVLGVWASVWAEVHFRRSDDGRIVVDEVAGQLIALAPLVPFAQIAAETGDFSTASIFWIAVTGFVAFRLFDIAKPGPVGWAERKFRGGVGVMADDIVAGLMSAVIVVAVQWIVFGTDVLRAVLLEALCGGVAQ